MTKPSIQTTRRKRKISGSSKGWAPKDNNAFGNDSGEKLAEARAQPDPNWHTMQADAKCRAIEAILLELAAEHRGNEKETPSEDEKAKIRELIGN